jgi:hypothetical protein
MATTASDVVTTAPVDATVKAQPDMTSILAKLQQLEKLNQKLEKDAVQKDERLGKLTESKKLEMQGVLQSSISKFIADLDTKDEQIKLDLTTSLQNIANKGQESGVWEIMACASAGHALRVTELETLRTENNALKERETALSAGMFTSEGARVGTSTTGDQGGSRKRGPDEIAPATCMWDDFQTMLSDSGGISSTFTN